MFVSIDEFGLEKGSITIDMSVFGVYPESTREVMDLLTRVFSKLSFNYLRVSNAKLSMLGYYLAMLAREKVFIASVPEDTYIFRDYPSLEQAVEYVRKNREKYGEKVVDLFVDMGSPFKHIYFVSRDYTSYPEIKSCGYSIIGRGYLSNEEIYIHADFVSELPYCTAKWCTEDFLERMERLMRDGELHIEPYPGMNNTKKDLLEKAIKLASKQAYK